MTWKVGQKVQDASGCTGTITEQYDDQIVLDWDISGCSSEPMHESSVVEMVPGQDDERIQNAIYHGQMAMLRGDAQEYGPEREHNGRRYREILDETGEGTDYFQDVETKEVCTVDFEGWDE